ncbi:MAG: hypothetical protein WBC55_02480 [Dehalococcoidia bacterium]
MKYSRILIFALVIVMVVTVVSSLARFAFTPKPGPTPTPTSSPMPHINIESVKICSDVRGPGDYTIQPNAAFQLGDKVFIYFEMFDFTIQSNDGTYEYSVTFDEVSAYDSNNELFYSGFDFGGMHETEASVMPVGLAAYTDFEIPLGSPTGQYWAELIVRDELSEETAYTTAYFAVE